MRKGVKFLVLLLKINNKFLYKNKGIYIYIY
jgi:hypothetical protein